LSYGHKPVLLDEVIEALKLRADGYYIDATFGRGGHSREILKRLGSQGKLFAFDKDPDAVKSVSTDLVQDQRFDIIKGSFTMLMQQVKQHDLQGQIAGVLFDFGVSSPQLDDAERGFSFRFDAPLDMRMNPEEGQSVAEWLNKADETDIANVIYEYGEERASRRIAKNIVNERVETPIETTTQLAELVRRAVPSKKPRHRGKDIHPATKTFQALRIFINRELDDIKEVLPQAVDVLCPGGRLVAISFHSLEDRIVKRFMRDESTPKEYPPELPIMPDDSDVNIKRIGKKIRAGEKELNENPRARSAVLRVAERL
jgi:16S rRNA (cytosine1402-N4)-methyltransferase